jgi:hypothetical protein
MSDVIRRKRAALYDRIVETNAESMIESQKKLKITYPYERLKGNGFAFFLNPETRQMVKITLGRLVSRISETPDHLGRHVIITQNETVLVPKELLEEIGYH